MNTTMAAIRGKKMPLLFGILLPLFCVGFDPYVFKGNGPLAGAAGSGYALVLIGVLAMSYWLARRNPSPFLAGIFFACNLLSALIGLCIAPASFIGLLLFGLGLLGFIPFGTAYVFYRQGRDIWDASSSASGSCRKCLIGFGICLALVFSAQVGARHLVDSAVASLSAQSMPGELQNFTAFCAEPLGLEMALILEWRKNIASERGQRIAAVYEARYGLNIEFGETLMLD